MNLKTILGSLLLGALFVVALPATAQESGANEQETRKTPAMREKVYKKLAEAQVCAEAKDPQCARRLLDQVRAMTDLNSYETAQMWNFYAFIYYELGNEREAMQAYERVLQQPDLPIGLENGTMYTLAQLYATTDQYQKSIDMLNRWLRTQENPNPEAYILISQNYYQLERYQDGVAPAQKAISMAQSQGKAVKENWYMLLNVLYYQLENYGKVREVLEILASNWPKKDYFTQLAAVYGELELERRQLAVYEAAFSAGWLDRGGDLVRLAQLLMQAEVPYKAAKIIEKGLADGNIESTANNWRMLSQAWTLAQEDEKAIPSLQRAARLSNDGTLDVRLAQSHLNLDQYPECVKAARAGLSKGNLRRTDGAQIVLGMCLYEQKQYNPAKEAFRQARKDSRSRKSADQWIRFIESEQDRNRQLADALRQA